MLHGGFHLPIFFDVAASFLFAVTGAISAVRKRYDLVGILVLSFATGLGGALLRDGLFLQQGPAAVLTDGRYLLGVLGGGLTGAFFGRHVQRARLAIEIVDALALGVYGVVGAQKSLAAGLPLVSVALVGCVNAVGGGMLRDVLVREEPLIFKPGEFYALAALAGVLAFIALAAGLHLPEETAAIGGIGLAFMVRLLSIRLGWRTGAFEPDHGP
ncbi:trimeric intracellular cation channel family protein [Anaeromyxobacter terrae]|uniref:trimeric intracellular cation channel family protein n=1 Tax=Anaeromyxobacter terrae TaxID=2925406 RepID=UPI001F59654C|nr:TRIC cation channel family protein [Anaeromyxobacter sp. SG22]